MGLLGKEDGSSFQLGLRCQIRVDMNIDYHDKVFSEINTHLPVHSSGNGGVIRVYIAKTR